MFQNTLARDSAVRCTSAKLNHEALHNFEEVKEKKNKQQK